MMILSVIAKWMLMAGDTWASFLTWLKENASLAAWIGVPIALVALFFTWLSFRKRKDPKTHTSATGPESQAAGHDAFRADGSRTVYQAEKMIFHEGSNIKKKEEAELAIQRQVPSPVPRAAPMPPKPFIGREEEIKAAMEALRSGGHFGLFGMGGIGKTAIAKKVVEGLQKEGSFTEDAIWIAFTEPAETESKKQVRSFREGLLDLGEALRLSRQGLQEIRPEAVLSRVAAELGKTKRLAVFDGLTDFEGLHEFLSFGRGNSAVLITSRTHLGMWGKDIPGFTDTEKCQSLFYAHCEKSEKDLSEAEQKAVQEICKRLQGHPLGIELAGASCCINQLSPSEYLEQLNQPRGMLKALTNVPGKEDLARNLMMSYELLKDERDKSLFRVCGVFETDFDEEIAAEIRDIDNGRQRFDRLVQARLVERKDGRAVLHDFLRDLARQLLSDSKEEKTTYEKAADTYSLHMKEREHAFAFLEVEQENAVWIQTECHRLGLWPGAISLASLMGESLHVRGYWNQSRQVLELGLDAASKSGEKEHIALLAHNLAIALQKQGEYDKARALYDESLAIKKELGNQAGIGLTLGQMGRLEEELGNLKAARENYKKALGIFQSLGAPEAQMAEQDLRRVEKALREKGGGG